jgi:hypothetical protein
MTNRASLLPWTLANALGMALGFLTFIQTLNFIGFGFEFESHWSEAAIEAWAAAHPANAERVFRLGLMLGLPLAGTIFTACQAWVLRGDLRRPWLWVSCGAAGFLVPILVIWPLTAIWGDIPGPVEPFTIVGGGLLGVAILQWLLLRRRGVYVTRWLVLWIVGLPLGMVVFVVVVGAAKLLIGAWPPWPLEIALYGVFIGGSAAAVSGRALLARIESRSPADEH